MCRVAGLVVFSTNLEMPSLKQKQAIDRAIIEGVPPRQKGNSVFLKSSTGTVFLERNATQTPAGKFYFERVQRPWQASTQPKMNFENAKEQPSKNGLSFFIQHGNKKMWTRVWDKKDQVLRITKAGDRYLKESKVTLSVILPLIARDPASGREFETRKKQY